MAKTALPVLIDIYGSDAVPAAKRGVRAELAIKRKELEDLYAWAETVGNDINGIHFKKQPAYIKWRDEYVENYETKLKREITRLSWDLDYLNSFDSDGFRPETYQPTAGVSDEAILRAKEVDIRSLVQVNRALTKCLWHDDKRPSMHVYKDNHAYCFVCSKHADAIDFFMLLNGCTFVEAVKRMAP